MSPTLYDFHEYSKRFCRAANASSLVLMNSGQINAIMKYDLPYFRSLLAMAYLGRKLMSYRGACTAIYHLQTQTTDRSCGSKL